jgi:hypothetical protein
VWLHKHAPAPLAFGQGFTTQTAFTNTLRLCQLRFTWPYICNSVRLHMHLNYCSWPVIVYNYVHTFAYVNYEYWILTVATRRHLDDCRYRAGDTVFSATTESESSVRCSFTGLRCDAAHGNSVTSRLRFIAGCLRVRSRTKLFTCQLLNGPACHKLLL